MTVPTNADTVARTRERWRRARAAWRDRQFPNRTIKVRSTPRERFDARWVIWPPTGCWLWTGRLDGSGYGQFDVENTSKKAHRVAYEWLVGPIPDGMELDHVKARGCIGPACVNPAHLEPVTHAENVRRGDSGGDQHNRQKTHCPRGHEYSPENTYRTSRGRFCRECHRTSARAAAERRRQP